jgi:hypothetical protein
MPVNSEACLTREQYTTLLQDALAHATELRYSVAHESPDPITIR